MTPHESHLKSDGTVFPPVTPDPPRPPGMKDIEVPDIVPVRTSDGPSTTKDTYASDEAEAQAEGSQADDPTESGTSPREAARA